MIRKLVRLSNGTEIFSGPGSAMNIRSCTVTQCVNAGEELTIGSVCAACVEMLVQAPSNTFRSEDVFTLYDVDDAGVETKIGLFNVESTPRKGENLFRVIAYDNVWKLDRDLSDWFAEHISSLNNPHDYIVEVCKQCGLVAGELPSYSVSSSVGGFSAEGKITGRKLLQWLAEMLCYFVVADEEGKICFRWYSDNTKIVLGGSLGRYRLQGSYKYNVEILPIDGIRIFLDNGLTRNHPHNATITNPYVIRDNPILSAKEWEDSSRIAGSILEKLNADRKVFTHGINSHLAACEVTTPASHDVRVGDIIVVDEMEPVQGEADTPRVCMRVMTKIQKGQIDTLKCTGSYRRRN